MGDATGISVARGRQRRFSIGVGLVAQGKVYVSQPSRVRSMDDQTERLRDIFMDVAEDESVTERQAERRGTLATDAAAIDERLADVVARMRERFEFAAELDTETYVDIVRGFYDGREDDALAEELDLDPATVRQARADLHLVEPEDAGDVDLEAARERVAAGEDPEAAATAAEADEPERVAPVLAAMDRSRRVSQRFRSEFEEILTDADISVRLTADAQEDGLAEATEDAEVDVDF